MLKSNPIPILLYHSISEKATPSFSEWTLPPQTFVEHLEVIRENGCTPMTVSELVAVFADHLPLPQSPVVMTFDDGLADFYENAFPNLVDFGFTATLFITTSFVERTSEWLSPLGEGNRPMLTWEQIKELAKYGIECGSHSHTHPELDTLSYSEALFEISHSKQILEDRLGDAVRSFAYPHGYFTNTTQRIVQQSNYTSACAVKNAFSALNDDCFALSRINVTKSFDKAFLSRLLNGQGYRVTKLREGPYTKVWRFWRNTVRFLQNYLERAIV